MKPRRGSAEAHRKNGIRKGITDETGSLEAIGKRFFEYCRSFANHFLLPTRSVCPQAERYLRGLMQARKKNMERMAEVVPDTDEQQLQHFLSNSTWDERAVLDQVALEADELLGGAEDSALLIDESGLTKKGRKSAGVARQWNGRLGKVDNCQVGVFAALSRGNRSTLIDAKLFLPTEWVNSATRCNAAKIPDEEQIGKTKPELALEMIRHNRELGVQFAWVGADGLYGNDPKFLRALDDDGEVFVIDVHRDQRIYLEDPRPTVPLTPAGQRGRKRTRRVAQTEATRVDNWAKTQPDAAWEQVTLRDSTKGKLRVEVLHRRIWSWDGREAQARCWHLVVRRELNSRDEIKYCLSNASQDTQAAQLAKMQGQRYWIERSFQDGKSQSGLDHYQARSWRAWHRHMTLVMMAMLFMLKERIANQDAHPLMSCADIEVLLAHFLPRRDIEPEEVIRQMHHRHQKRQASIDQAYLDQQLDSGQRTSGNVTK